MVRVALHATGIILKIIQQMIENISGRSQLRAYGGSRNAQHENNEANHLNVRSSIEEKKCRERLKQKLSDTVQQIESASMHQLDRLPDPIQNANMVADLIFRPLHILSGDIVDFAYCDTFFNFAIFDSAGTGTVAADASGANDP